jgi:hypothetical protein
VSRRRRSRPAVAGRSGRRRRSEGERACNRRSGRHTAAAEDTPASDAYAVHDAAEKAINARAEASAYPQTARKRQQEEYKPAADAQTAVVQVKCNRERSVDAV